MNLLYCGIDISKDTAVFSLLDSESNPLGKTTTFNNNPQGFRKAIKWLRKLSKPFKPYSVHVSMEATNVYYLSLAKFFSDQTSTTVSVVNPSQVKSYAKAELVRTKTDGVDAAVIARFTRTMNPTPWTPPEPHEEEILSVLRHVESIKKMIQAEKNRLLTLEEIGSTTANVQKAIKKHIKFLESQIGCLTGRLKKVVKEHPEIDDNVKLLCSIPGIGDTTAYMLIAEIGNIGRFENVKQLVAYAGIAPAQRQSGTSVRGKSMINKHGSKRLRKALYMPAMVAAQYNPVIEKFYQRLISAGKKPLCALVACMRKLLHIVYGVLKNKKHFDPAWNKPFLA
jgi:transposase